ncbi:ATP-binding protein [Streptomyces sp. NBC_01288]|uniref:ATP-binding protein n=1 Tax=Streptomyces sp. NBC_01288 TaxID=2903814 RepID=UPI003FA3B478
MRRTLCGNAGPRKRTAPSCHDGRGRATAGALQPPIAEPELMHARKPRPCPGKYCLYVPNDLRAVTVSRRTLRLILTVHGLIRLADTSELLATELVANAVLHAEGPAALRVGWSAGVLRFGAWDADPEPPEPPRALEELGDAEDGRGLALVRVCTDQWGWQPLSRHGRRGKLVWCELAAA